MKTYIGSIARVLVIFALLALSVIPICGATVVTFDDLSETGSGAFFSFQDQGYQGLTWNNILCNNAVLFTNVLPHEFLGAPPNGLSGDYYGMMSSSNVAKMLSGCEIDSSATNFNFLSAYLTGDWNSNLNIEVQGFNGTNLLYDTTVIASATNATLFTFNYQNINRLYFTSSGGQPAFGVTDGDSYFVMDNFDFEFIPEPSALLLTGIGTLLLWPILKHRCASQAVSHRGSGVAVQI